MEEAGAQAGLCRKGGEEMSIKANRLQPCDRRPCKTAARPVATTVQPGPCSQSSCVLMDFGLRSRTTTCRKTDRTTGIGLRARLGCDHVATLLLSLLPQSFPVTRRLLALAHLLLVVCLQVGVGGRRRAYGDGAGQHADDLAAAASGGTHQEHAMTDGQQLAGEGGRAALVGRFGQRR